MNLDAATLAAWFCVLGGCASAALWLRSEVKRIVSEANDRQIHSEAFESRVAKITGSAMTGALEPLMRALSDVEARQRDHGRRIGDLEQAVAALRGRIERTRGNDL